MLAASGIRFCSVPTFTALCLALTALPAQSATVVLPGSASVNKVDFERHLMGVFGRAGCNSGSCHGSFQGRGGFRLSLFGYDPEKDYMALTRDVLGRRLNPVDPDNSLLLLKATGQVPHDGGVRFQKDSWQYKLFKEWITAGAPWQKGSGEVANISVNPPEHAFKKAGEVGKISVKARFADGSEEDITSLCDYRINDDTVAELAGPGQVKSLRPGDTAMVVSYRGNVLPVRLLVPVESKGQYHAAPEVNYIDKHVFTKLKRLNVEPSALASDAEFLRRVTIDTIGTLPTPDEVRAFLNNKDPNKRAQKIDELLAHPMHAALWATKFSDITGNDTPALENPQQLKPKLSQMWHDWFRKRVADNMPYDEIVRGVLCATSRDDLTPEKYIEEVKKIEEAANKGFATTYADRKSLDLFWRRQQNVPVEQWGEKVAAAFLGIRLECAQCHKHPFDRWTQTDYRAHANVFTQVTFGTSPEAKKAIDAENAERRKAQMGKNNRQVLQVREIFVGAPGKGVMNHPETNKPLAPKFLGGPEIKLEAGKDAREALFNWLKQPDNPYFSRSFVNRVWGHYFGIGIVNPVDDFSLANPPSNPELLNALAKDFLEHKFDIRYIERTVLNSRTYQLASAPNASNGLDKNNYSHSYIRPMMAEVVVDVLNTAMGTTENLAGFAPPNAKAIEIGASQIQRNDIMYAFRIFGRPPRTQACDCERAMDPALPQTLYRMTDPVIQGKLQNGRVTELLKTKKTDEEILDELFLAVLSRFPNDKEKETFTNYKAVKKDRKTLFVDTLWALINTREFILNH